MTNHTSMSRLDDVILEFSRSMDRLQTALAGRPPGESLPLLAPESEAEIERLKEEKQALQRELDAIYAENDRLASLAETIAGQLDGAIEDVHAVLKKAE